MEAETGGDPMDRCELTPGTIGQDIDRKMLFQPDLFLWASWTPHGLGHGSYDGHRGSVFYLAVTRIVRLDMVRLMAFIEDTLIGLGCPKLNIAG